MKSEFLKRGVDAVQRNSVSEMATTRLLMATEAEEVPRSLVNSVETTGSLLLTVMGKLSSLIPQAIKLQLLKFALTIKP